MNNLNQVFLLGNLTRDPEVKYTDEGIAIAEMRLAVNKRWKDKDGKDIEIVDYFNVTAWGSLAENCVDSLKKGDRIVINGHLNLRNWEAKDGKKYNLTNIVADVVAASLEFKRLKIYNRTEDEEENEEEEMVDANTC
ncbi:MAG: single-stranded DNA-binding protein [Actinobacteria bacterium]|nr:single-stranded DNA-binding protein [Actinomycetota bacterium]